MSVHIHRKGAVILQGYAAMARDVGILIEQAAVPVQTDPEVGLCKSFSRLPVFTQLLVSAEEIGKFGHHEQLIDIGPVCILGHNISRLLDIFLVIIYLA